MSVMVRNPFLVPLVDGSKKTPMEHCAPGLMLFPHALSGAKSAGLALTFVMVSTASPVFVSVTDCGRPEVPTYWLGKVMLGGDKLMPLTPVPVKGTLCGLPGALSITVSEALALPSPRGVKVTLIWQLLPDVSDEGQLLVWPKSPLFAPVIWMDVMDKLILPVF